MTYVMQPYKLLNQRLKNLENRRSWRLILSQNLQIQKTYMQNQRLLYRKERKNRMPKKTHSANNCRASDDPEQLQALDESNTEWVEAWKRTVKKKIK